MVYKLGDRSRKNMRGLHPDLVRVINTAMSLQVIDFSVIEGVRSEKRQKTLKDQGYTRTLRSKHLIQIDGYAHAVDLYPYPIDMNLVNKSNVKENARFGILAGVMLSAAAIEGVTIINGMDWDGDGETLDHNFYDAPHYELMGIV